MPRTVNCLNSDDWTPVALQEWPRDVLLRIVLLGLKEKHLPVIGLRVHLTRSRTQKIIPRHSDYLRREFVEHFGYTLGRRDFFGEL